MRNEYIPLPTKDTIYYKPKNEQEFIEMTEQMKVGDMILKTNMGLSRSSLWYTMGLLDKNDLETMFLSPNILMGECLESLEHFENLEHLESLESLESLEHLENLEPLKNLEHLDHLEHLVSLEHLEPLSRWGMERMNYLKEHKKVLVLQMDIIELHKHCLEIEKQAMQRKHNMMEAIRKDPVNKVTEKDKVQDPMAWVGRMNKFQAQVHEVIYNDLIYG